MAERDSRLRLPSDKVTETTSGSGSSDKVPETLVGVKPRFYYLRRLFMPWKWKRKKSSDKFKSISNVLERKMSTRMTKDQLMEMGLIPPSQSSEDSSILKSTENPCYDEADFSQAAAGHSVSQTSVQPGEECVEFDCSWVTEVGVIPPPAMFSPPHFSSFSSPPDAMSTPSHYYASSASMVSVMAVGEGLDLSDPVLSKKIGRFPQDLKDINENKETERLEVIEAINSSFQPDKSLTKTPRLAEVVKTLMGTEQQNKVVLQVSSPVLQDESLRESGDSGETSRFSSSARKFSSPGQEISIFPPRPPLKEKPANICCQSSQDEWREKRERIGRSLERRLSTRPSAEELRDRNLIPKLSREEKEDIKRRISVKLERRLSIRPTEADLKNRNILKQESSEQSKQKQEETKTILQRKLSIRPSVSELRRRKILKFSDYHEVVECESYDRTADKPWTRLTPRDKASIRKELNEFKSGEMEVHQDSRHMTRFHKP